MKSAVAYFPSISCATSCWRSLYWKLCNLYDQSWSNIRPIFHQNSSSKKWSWLSWPWLLSTLLRCIVDILVDYLSLISNLDRSFRKKLFIYLVTGWINFKMACSPLDSLVYRLPDVPIFWCEPLVVCFDQVSLFLFWNVVPVWGELVREDVTGAILIEE